MPLVEYRRLSGAPPPSRELLTVEADGAYQSWRSIAPVIGRFAGRVPDPDGLERLVEAAREKRPPKTGRLPADAAYEVVTIKGREGRFQDRAEVDGPWGALLSELRELVDRTDEPLAAIALVVDDDGLRLEHRGTEPLHLELGSAKAEIVVWSDGQETGSSQGRVRGVRGVEADPGWNQAVDIDPVARDGGNLVATVAFIADDGGVDIPVVAETIVRD